ncbi:MAG TPA: tetratricopeptide repeat-containing protein [Pyrinomonadaceae bacterium]|nr:tetratricopeptide repeat-containing protein [Pyrinomonadaceae bacterium]
MAQNRFDIAIIYAPHDAMFAEALASRLQRSGMHVWFDQWSIKPGEWLAEAFTQGVAQSEVVAVCISSSIQRDHTRLHLILEAHKQQQIVLPILLRGSSAEDVPPELRNLGITKSTDPQTATIVYTLIEALVSMELPSAATYLLQQSLAAPPGFFQNLKNLFGKGSDEAPKVQPKTVEVKTDEVKGLKELAKRVLRGHSAEPGDLLKLAGELKRAKQFGYARRILARARLDPSINDDSRVRRTIFQQLALCTYKDPDLPADTRLDRALEILRELENLADSIDQETLGLAGAIYKRKWEIDNQTQQLERSLSYYLRGYEQGPANDQGYTGINAAFVLDLIAQQEEDEARKAQVVSDVAKQRRAKAREIRSEIVKQVAPLLDRPDTDWLQGKWWFYSTVAEAYFGLGEYDEAIRWLERGRDDAEEQGTSIAPWEHESTARQLATLARLGGDSAQTEKALAALSKFFQLREVQSAYVGKVGLALSGGGFRAALFHIGVLARLAELDVLRRVEVLSCVSGGAIIGAHYYLEVRKLLQTKPDSQITRDDYIEIISRVRKDFLAGVQRNVRTRVALNPMKTLKMLLRSKYSRTMRAGELYETEIFSRVQDGGQNDSRWLNGLYVCPVDEDGKPDETFDFKTDNWRREAKVPNLILNTTSLNTGHNWQFTASWMGEPPAGIDSEIDGNDRLRRLYYDGEDTPKARRQIRLGHAVAASACVPGLFEPLPLDQLYPERVVRLVDGGVCDNQGVASLLEQDCTIILVSDGSGQMESQKDPSIGLLGVPLRSNTILQARVREAQYRELSARRRASLLRGFMFVHLKDDLDVDPIDWIGCLDPFDASDDSRPAYRRGPLTKYGIAKDLQELLSGVRTDLDSFSDVEAFALMTSGYRMTEHEFKHSKCVEGFAEPEKQYAWDFLAVEEGMTGGGGKYEFLKKRLRVGNSLAFKIWKLSWPLTITAWILGIAAVVLAVWACFQWASAVVLDAITLWDVGVFIATTILMAVATYIVGKKIMQIVRLRETLIRLVAYLITAAVGWFAAALHLLIFDPLFLRNGSLRSFKKVS